MHPHAIVVALHNLLSKLYLHTAMTQAQSGLTFSMLAPAAELLDLPGSLTKMGNVPQEQNRSCTSKAKRQRHLDRHSGIRMS